MRKFILTLLVAIALSFSVSAKVTINLPEGAQPSYWVEYVMLSDEKSDAVGDSIAVVNGVLSFDVTDKGVAEYYIPFAQREAISFYSGPGDNLVVNVSAVSPLEYTVSGNLMMDGIGEMKPKARALVQKARELSAAGAMTEAISDSLQNEYNGVFRDFIKNNPTSPASIYAMTNLPDEEFLTCFESIPESLKATAYYNMALSRKKYADRRIAAEKKIEELQSGNVDAPSFTFKNLDGKDVSLSDFKGKWVIIDFWGGWCSWCIKGIPKLKEAYEQYKPELEIIGIDCNESEEAWRKAVAKYELPWVNVYNPQRGGDSGVLADYGVQGFPTKVIVNPEGKIADVAVGDNPEFFAIFGKLINGN